jgi:hypothetical protein
MTPITRESARLSVSEAPVSGRGDTWPLCETALGTFSDWLDERLCELEDRFRSYRTRSSVRVSIVGKHGRRSES